MKLELDEEERSLIEGAEKLVSRHAEGSGTIEDRSANLWRALTEAGWTALFLDEVDGGIGASIATMGTIFERIGNAGLETPLLSSMILGARLLGRARPSGPVREQIEAISTGQVKSALLIMPDCIASLFGKAGTGSPVAPIRVLDAATANLFLVYSPASTGARFHLLTRDSPGLSVRKAPTLRSADDGELRLDLLPDDICAIDFPDPAAALEITLDEACLMTCFEALGAMRWLIGATAEYARTRRQFGRALTELQAVRHRLAEMQVAHEDARAATCLAAMTMRDADRRARSVTAAKLIASEASIAVAEGAIQLHGAMGVTEELSVGRYVRRLTAFQYLFGGRSSQIDRYTASTSSIGAARKSAILESAS